MNQLIINLGVSAGLALIIAGSYLITHRHRLNVELLLTIIILPLVVTMIIYTIGSNIAGAFSLSGIFSIVRFRSEQATFKEITYILFCVAVGLAAATEFYIEGLAFAIIAVTALLLFDLRRTRNVTAALEIIMPEDMQDSKSIEKIIKKYCKRSYMASMKTRDLGSLYEYNYRITYKETLNLQEMIDEIRVINSNLPIKILV